MPSVEQRQLDIFARGSTRQEIKALENKPQFTVADIGQSIAIPTRDLGIIEEILSAGRPIKTAKESHKGRFSRTARAHQGNEFAALTLERHSAHGLHFYFARAICFVHGD